MARPSPRSLKTLGIALLLAVLLHLVVLFGIALAPAHTPPSSLTVSLQSPLPTAQPRPESSLAPAASTKPVRQQEQHPKASTPLAVPDAHAQVTSTLPQPAAPATTVATNAPSVGTAQNASATPQPAPVSDAGSQGSPTAIKQPPRLLKRVEPAYPPQARSQGQEGLVRVKLHIDSTGRPVSKQLLASSGSDLLDNALLAVVLQWQFSPALTAAGQVTDADLIIPYRFRLQSANDD